MWRRIATYLSRIEDSLTETRKEESNVTGAQPMRSEHSESDDDDDIENANEQSIVITLLQRKTETRPLQELEETMEDGFPEPDEDTSPEYAASLAAELLSAYDAVPNIERNNAAWQSLFFYDLPIPDEFTLHLRWTFTWSPTTHNFHCGNIMITSYAPDSEEQDEGSNISTFYPISIRFSNVVCTDGAPPVLAFQLNRYCNPFMVIRKPASRGRASDSWDVTGEALPSANEVLQNKKSAHRTKLTRSAYLKEQNAREIPIIVEQSALLIYYCQSLTTSDLKELEIDRLVPTSRSQTDEIDETGEPGEPDGTIELGETDETGESGESGESAKVVNELEQEEQATTAEDDLESIPPGSEQEPHTVKTPSVASSSSATSSSSSASSSSFNPSTDVLIQNYHTQNLRSEYITIRRTLKLAVLLNALTSPEYNIAVELDHYCHLHWGSIIVLPLNLWTLIKYHVPPQLEVWELRQLIPQTIDFPALAKPTVCKSELRFSADVTVIAFPT